MSRVAAPYRMLARPGPLLRGLMHLLFHPIHYPNTAASQIRTLADGGTLVYVVRGRSAWLTLCFAYLLQRVGLPLASLVGGVNYVWMQPLSGLWRALRQRRRMPVGPWQLEPVRLRRREALIADASCRGETVYIALPTPRSARTYPTDTNDYLRALIVAQRHSSRPLYLLPHVLVNREQSGATQGSLVDRLFGDRRYPGALRRIAMLLTLRHGSVRMADPIDLQAVVLAAPDADPTELARRVRYDLHRAMGDEERVVAGPYLSSHDITARRVLRDPWVRQAVAAENARTGASDLALEARAQNILQATAARYDVSYIRAMSHVLNMVFNRIYDGIAVDETGLEAVVEAARRGPLIFCPSHRSHIDYLVLSYVLWQHGFAPPHIAAGANLSFFPLGFLFRRCGAFFLRRSFRTEDPLYGAVFRAYISELIKEGVGLEFFLEGTRSRTGKLLLPKFGLLSMIVQAWRRGVRDDIHFVPVSIDYERIIEANAYQDELKGRSKRAENISGLLKSTQVLRSRYGRVQVQFGDPISLAALAQTQGLPQNEAPEHEPQWRAHIERLGFRILHSVAEVCSVTPTAVVATTLLGHPGRGMSEALLVERSEATVRFLGRPAARISQALAQEDTRQAAILAAVRKLVDDRLVVIEHAGKSDREPIYRVPDDRRVALDFHKNALMNYFVPAALVARAMRRHGMGRGDYDRIRADTRFLSRLFKREFIYRVESDYDAYFSKILAFLADRQLLTFEVGVHITATDPAHLAHLAGLIDNFVQSYWIASRTLLELAAFPLWRQELIQRALERVNRAFLEGDISRPEAASRPLIETALQWLTDANLVEMQASGRRKASLVTGAAAQSKLHLLIDEIGAYI